MVTLGTARPRSDGWARYVALGDSSTEGVGDPAPGGGLRGWADRLAGLLDASARAAGRPPVQYANLAVRGRLLAQVLDEQLPVALGSGADLVSLVAGGHDVLRPGSDVDALAAALEEAVAALRATGAQVLLATGADPRDAPVVRRARGRTATCNAHLWSIADRHGAAVVDLWGLRALRDRRLWAPDRIHLAPEGHRRVALLAARALGLDPAGLDPAGVDPAGGDVHAPLPPAAALRRWDAAREDAAWARAHLAPWVGRRLRGRSSGDGRVAKRPVPADWAAPALDVRD